MSSNVRIEAFFLGSDEYRHIVLPAICEGCFQVYGKAEKTYIQIIARHEQWYIQALVDWRFKNGEAMMKLEKHKLYELQHENEKAVLWLKAYQESSHHFQTYHCLKTEILIGRAKECEIMYGQEVVSYHHARMFLKNNQWYIVDLKSANKTYVNERCIYETETALALFDCVQIMELRIVVTPFGLCMNTCDALALRNDAWKEALANTKEALQTHEVKSKWLLAHEFQKQLFCVDSPPRLNNAQQTPAFLVLAPSMTMGISSLSMGVFALLQMRMQKTSLIQTLPTLMMSFTMALSSMVWPLVLHFYERHKHKVQTRKIEVEYQRYLQDLQVRINKEMQAYRFFRQQQYPTLSILYQQLTQGVRMLFDKQGEQLLLGTYKEEYQVRFEQEKQGFTLYQNELEKARSKLLETKHTLNEMPLVWERKQFSQVDVAGSKSKLFLLGILMQYVITHQESKHGLIVHMDYAEAKQLQITSLAHLYAKQGGIRYLLCGKKEIPQFATLFAQDDRQFLYIKLVKEFHVHDAYLLGSEKVSCLSLLPLEYAKAQITVKEDQASYRCGRKESIFTPMFLTRQEWECCIYMLVKTLQFPNVWRNQKPYRFLDMFQCGNIQALQIWQRWQKSDPSMSLACVIGHTMHHQPLVLDAHEKGHGPHGLFAGMTGSGKTECLITYILSMCIQYSPKDIHFLLIDYKGGVMAQTLSQLPHVVGVITNLDSALLQRSLYALKHEMLYRQQLFIEASRNYHMGNINIDSYNQLAKKQKSFEALAHLFIIADEFAEMKQQQPQFMEQLKQIARIGRSLGVHLLLATQKPFGVIDEQIWSNARFHLCMKVQSAQDSQDMLKNQDALRLKDTGSCIFQVGHNEIYEFGQIAWAQAGYEEQEEYEEASFRDLCFLQSDANIVVSQTLCKQTIIHKTQMEAVIQEINTLAKEHDLVAKPLWNQPLSSSLVISDSNALIMIDDVLSQKQFFTSIDEKDFCHTLLCGDSTTSKTMYLQRFLYALIKCYQDEKIVVYILDLADHELLAWKGKRLICEVLSEFDEELIPTFFHQLAKRVSSLDKKEYSKIFLIIHNFELFCERFDQEREHLVRFLRDGQQLGIICYLSVRSIDNVSYRFLPFLTRKIAFYMHDEKNYQSLFEQEEMLYPRKQKGNGIMLYEGHLVLFQVLASTGKTIEKSYAQASWQKHFALRLLPEHIVHACGKKALYLGKDVEDIEDVYLDIKKVKYTILCAAYKLPLMFEKLFLKQLRKHNAQMVTTLEEIKTIKQPSIFIWQQEQLLKEELRTYLLKDSIDDMHCHYVFFHMEELRYQMQALWRLPNQRMVWLGTMFDSYSYDMDLEITPHVSLKHNQGICLEGRKWIKFQVWEEEGDV